jgi:hypothetical protein
MNSELDHLRTDIDCAVNELTHACALFPDQAEDRMRRALYWLMRCQSFLKNLDSAAYDIFVAELNRPDGRAFSAPPPSADS